MEQHQRQRPPAIHSPRASIPLMTSWEWSGLGRVHLEGVAGLGERSFVILAGLEAVASTFASCSIAYHHLAAQCYGHVLQKNRFWLSCFVRGMWSLIHLVRSRPSTFEASLVGLYRALHMSVTSIQQLKEWNLCHFCFAAVSSSLGKHKQLDWQLVPWSDKSSTDESPWCVCIVKCLKAMSCYE